MSAVPISDILLSQSASVTSQQASPSLQAVSPPSLNPSTSDQSPASVSLNMNVDLEQKEDSSSPNFMECMIPGTDINFDMVDLEDFLQKELDASAAILDPAQLIANNDNSMTE